MTDGITKIAVLDYSDPSVDIIEVNNKMLQRFGDIENYLTGHCGYNPDEISWMDATNAKFNIGMTHDSFSGCDDDEYTYWDDVTSVRRYRLRQVHTISFDVVLNGEEYKNLEINFDWDGTVWEDIYCKRGKWFLLTLKEGRNCCEANYKVDFQIYADDDGELYLNAAETEMCVQAGAMPWWEHTKDIDDIQVTRLDVDFYEEGNFQEDEIWIADKHIFGDNEEHKLKMWLYDGYAIEQDYIGNDIEGVERHPYILFYPTMEQAQDSGWMLDDVREYTGREDVNSFDLALKYGRLYTEKEIMYY